MQCVLCSNITLDSVYDLIRSSTLYSRTSLLIILQNCVQDQLNFTAHNICKLCFDLLNEFDHITLRAKAIQLQLQTYLAKGRWRKSPPVNITPSTTGDHDVWLEINENRQPSSGHGVAESASSSEAIEISDDTSEDAEAPLENDANDEQFRCILCHKECKNRAEMQSHLSTHNGERQYVCEICGRIYKQQKALDIHINMHKGINVYTCPECNKGFTQKGALSRHLPLHTGQTPHQCDICGKCFKYHTSLKTHKLSHTGTKSYKCEVCGLLLMSASHLKRHNKVHTGEKNYACDICGRRFAERYNMMVHVKMHSNTRVARKKKFECHLCDHSYSYQTQLEQHYLQVHNNTGILAVSQVKNETLTS